MIFPRPPFQIISGCTAQQHKKINAICDRYMTIDTVGHEESHAWQAKNFHCLMVVTDNNAEAQGYLELLPLTMETGPKLATGEFGETDILPENMLDVETMRYAQSVYIAAIAVDKPLSYVGGQCALALIAACCKQLLIFYDAAYLKTIFINPTTQAGFIIAKKLGFDQINASVNISRNSHMYSLDMSPQVWRKIRYFYDRYNGVMNYDLEKKS